MAASHPLTGIARDPEGAARWALGRMAAAAAEDIRFDAVAESAQHRVPQDVAGRYGAHSTLRFETSAPEPAVRDLNSSKTLLPNQLIDAAGMREEMDAAVEDMVGPPPKSQQGGEG